jgi:hypothetical protein
MALLTLSLLLIPIGLLISYILAYIRSPIKDIPGPFLAKFSDLWRFFNHYSRSHIETQKALHEKYGDTVRLGPNVVSVTDPALVKKIYEARGTFVKVFGLLITLYYRLVCTLDTLLPCYKNSNPNRISSDRIQLCGINVQHKSHH